MARQQTHVRLRSALRDSLVLAGVGPPRARMLRTGLCVGASFAVFLAAGRVELAVPAAIFANLMMFLDQGGVFGERLAVVTLGIAAAGAAGALGLIASGHEAAIIAGVLALAMAAGLVHGWMPGFEMIPRQALICFMGCAYLPIDTRAGWSVLVGGACVLLGIVLDFLIRGRERHRSFADRRADARFPGLAFGLWYGLAAVFGLVFAEFAGASRGYWVTLTIIVVMQPGSRASMLRALQRLEGTLAGLLFALCVISVTPSAGLTQLRLCLIFVLPFVWPHGFVRNYALGVAILSAWIMVLIDLGLPTGDPFIGLFEARLFDTAFGCVVAMAATIAADAYARRRAKPGAAVHSHPAP